MKTGKWLVTLLLTAALTIVSSAADIIAADADSSNPAGDNPPAVAEEPRENAEAAATTEPAAVVVEEKAAPAVEIASEKADKEEDPAEERTKMERDLVKALALREAGEYEKAVEIFADLSGKDFLDAAYWLGDAYYYGRGVENDFLEAAKWYKIAARNGNKDAAEMLAVMYYYGRGVPQDLTMSVRWQTGEVVSEEDEKAAESKTTGEKPKAPAAVDIAEKPKDSAGDAKTAPETASPAKDDKDGAETAQNSKPEEKTEPEAPSVAATPEPVDEGPQPLWKTNPGTPYYTARGYYLAPSQAHSGRMYAGDKAPAIGFEIVRPNNAAIRIGRLYTSCSCVQLSSTKTSYAQGEPAILELRNVRPTPLNGHIYELYVQLVSPVRETIRYDIFVKSEEVF